MTREAVVLLEDLKIHDTKLQRWTNLIDAIVEPPIVKLTMEGASSVEVTVNDRNRKLLRSPVLQHRSWAEVGGVRFELIDIDKAADTMTLVFEDGITAALRRVTSPLSVPAGSTTRAALAVRLAKEARVPYLVDPTVRPKVATPIERSAHGEDKTSSWDVLGEVAEGIHLRRFSDGRHFFFGSDEWLFDRDQHPTRVEEFTGAVLSGIDLDLGINQRASGASFTVNSKLWALPPGSVVLMGDDMGPGQGKWLVSEFSRSLSSTVASVTLVRARHELKEPKKQEPKGDSGSSGDSGDPNYVPTPPGAPAGGAPGSSAREAMVQFALAQAGDPYVYGASGPDAWDCSGLVQGATAAAGHQLTKPSASQWAAVVAAGKTMTIDQAIGTRGALLFRIGVAEYNHVAISLGNGSTMEARGTAYGCGVFGGAAGGGWTGAGWWV